MMKKLSKTEFMSLVVNDLYKRKRAAREKLKGADTHTIENCNKTKNFRRK